MNLKYVVLQNARSLSVEFEDVEYMFYSNMVSPVTEELRNFIFNQFPKLFRDAKLIEIENNKENLKGFTKELINNLNDVIKERTDSNKLQAKILK